MTDRHPTPNEDAKAAAEAKAADALARKHDAEAILFEAEARKAVAEAEGAELQYEAARDTWAEMHATDEYHRVYRFGESVSSGSVAKCMQTLARWVRLSDGPIDIELIFNSPGGSAVDGMALWDFLKSLQRDGHRITTVCRGMAASMAGILLQAGDVRVMGAESYLLIHEVSFGAGGKIGEVEDTTEFVNKMMDRIVAIFAQRSNMTARQIKARWKRKDWWMDSTEALALGFCDEVR